MYAKNTNGQELEMALMAINRLYDGNVKFKRGPEPKGKRLLFTLTVHDSHGKGGRLSHTRRRICAACWHVHGDFFDALFAINPDAEVTAIGRKITAEDGNWQDQNIGSQFQPMYHSEACECS